MKKFVIGLFAAALLAILPAAPGYAAEIAGGTCGENVSWSLSDEGIMTLEGTGSTDVFLNVEDQPWYGVSGEIRSLEVGDGITRLNLGLLKECTALTSVTMGDDVEIIGQEAFANCINLTRIRLSAGLKVICFEAFKACGFTEVVLPEGIETLEGRAFYNCGALTTVNLPDSLVNLHEEAFRGCWNLIGKDDPVIHVHAAGVEVIENRIEPTYEEGGSYDVVVYCTACGEELSRETSLVPKKEPLKDTPNYEKPAATGISKVTSPKSRTMTVTWKKKSGVTGYQIQYSLRSDFKSARTATVKGATKSSLKIGSLNRGKTYYVRIRTYKVVKGRTLYSSWSAKKSVAVKK